MDEEKKPTNLEEFRRHLMDREKQAFEAGVSTGFVIAALMCAAGFMLWSYYR